MSKDKKSVSKKKKKKAVWRKVVKYNYSFNPANGHARIQIQTKGNVRETFRFDETELPKANALIHMLRLHEGCEFKTTGPDSFRANGRKPGAG